MANAQLRECVRAVTDFRLPRLAWRGPCQNGLAAWNEANPRAVRRSWRWQVGGQNKALGESRLQVFGEAQEEAEVVGSTAAQEHKGGQWKLARGVGSVCACRRVGRAARSGRRSWR